MMQLYLCEKPSQARDIAAILGARDKGEGCYKGAGVMVTWCIGHLLEMAPPEAYDPAFKRWELAHLPIIPGQWRLEVTERGKGQFKAVKAALSQAREVVLATDADREGETIGREVLERCGWRGPVQRLWLSALDAASIRKALANLLPGAKTEPLYRAGLARARADWLVGMNLSRLYTLLGRRSGDDGVISVGRVQTPTLKLVVERDREIEGFKPVAFYVLEAELRARAGSFKARWQPPAQACDSEGRCLRREAAAAAARKIEGRQGRITRAETERKKEGPPLPFDLGTLQQEASRRFSMTAQQVLDIAQSLYETHKATTYPRTDCPYLPESQHAEARAVLQALASSDAEIKSLVSGADAGLCSRAWNDTRITAHHAIIPTSARVDLQRMTADERRLYDLIRRRYLAQFYPDHQYDQTTIEVLIEDETFKATGRVARIPGWRVVMESLPVEELAGDEDESAHQVLPPVVKDDAVQVTGVNIDARKTKPPPRYSDGTLIAAMKSVAKLVQDPALKAVLKETAGIGTEATRPGIIETLLKRGFLVRKGKKQLLSTDIGRRLIDTLPQVVTDPATTARWEQALDEIAQGRRGLDEFMAAQSQWLTGLVQSGKEAAPIPVPRPATEQQAAAIPCPTCGKPMARRKGKEGWFWGCSGYPECRSTLPDTDGKPGVRSERVAAVARKPIPERKVSSSGAVTCPTCQQGTLVLRTLKEGKNAGKQFYGCIRFPHCRHFAWTASR